MKYLDTETVGYTGPIVLIQTGTNHNNINLYHVWDHTVQETLDHIEEIINGEEPINIYNASFDSFHLHKLWNTWRNIENKSKSPRVEEVFELEKHSWVNAACLRPNTVVDTYIILTRGPFQFLLGRKGKNQIVVRKVPKAALEYLQPVLDKFTATLHPLLFAKFKDRSQARYWQYRTITLPNGDPDPKYSEFVDLCLPFNSAMGLKPFAEHVLHRETRSIEIPAHHHPTDEHNQEYRPYNNTWPRFIGYHRAYWKGPGVKYAEDDIRHLIDFNRYLITTDEFPVLPDIDSELAWMVGGVRHRGFSLNIPALKGIIDKAKADTDIIPTAPRQAMGYLRQVANPEQEILLVDTAKNTLVRISEADLGDLSVRANEILKQRMLDKQINLLEKLYEVGRFHPDFNVSGTKSNRMSGRGGLNAQGINRGGAIRSVFTFADSNFTLSGGDFEGQEVTILDAIISDSNLHAELLGGTKIHTLMWRLIHERPDATNDEAKEDLDSYTQSKNGVFSIFYGAQLNKFAETIRVSLERAETIMGAWLAKYPGFAGFVDENERMFLSMRQPGGLGTKVIWNEPTRYAESVYKFRRDFDLENQFVRFFFGLANNPPSILKEISGRVIRRDNPQSISGATQSAFYAAAFGVQAKNLRAAGNHRIQSTGAEITKKLQYAIWSIQPQGIHPWAVVLFNVHDEVMCVNNCPDIVAQRVANKVEAITNQIPLLSIDWHETLTDWSEK